MKLITEKISSWPKLAWVASFRCDASDVHVQHGPMVETSDDWIVEAVWAGEFHNGDFDRTDLVFGTGIRIRDDVVDFVTSGTTFEQLWYTTHQDVTYVANSLPALLAVADIELLNDYPHYRRDLHSIRRGLYERIKAIPTSGADVNSVYFNNLRLKDGELRQVEKADSAPSFQCYTDYRQFLFSHASLLRQNYESHARNHTVTALSSISSGYDSPAAAVVAREAGCRHTITIGNSSSFWRGSDSGKPIADKLGMTCDEYDRTANSYPDEVAVWAGCAWGGTLNYTLFDYPSPLCLFFTGWHGDTMWNLNDRIDPELQSHSDPFVRPDIGALGLCELRLMRGLWHCTVPFWGVRHAHELVKVTHSDEMVPWRIGGQYDKPIARRLAEEAGADRESFGQLKKNASLPDPFRWPRSPSDQASFRRYVADLGGFAPSRWQAACIRRMASMESLLHSNLSRRMKISRRFRPWIHWKSRVLIYQWANHQLRSHYSAGLGAVPRRERSTPQLHQ